MQTQTVLTLRDKGAIPFLISRLDDALLSVRSLALTALQHVTGMPGRDSPEFWRRWCEERGCAIPLGDAAAGVSSNPGSDQP